MWQRGKSNFLEDGDFKNSVWNLFPDHKISVSGYFCFLSYRNWKKKSQNCLKNISITRLSFNMVYNKFS